MRLVFAINKINVEYLYMPIVSHLCDGDPTSQPSVSLPCSLEPGPTWLLIVLGRQERAWGPVKIDHYSSLLLGRKVTNNAARKWNASTTTRGVWSRHWFETVESEFTKWSVAFAVLSCEVPARSVCLVVASHGVTDHGSNEIISLSVLFQSSKSFFFLPAALQHAGMAKASRKCCRRKAFGIL